MKKLTCALLVDDNNATNVLHKKLMANAGVSAQIRIARNGEEAIDYLEHCQSVGGKDFPMPELILMDINMPKMNAWEFLETYNIRKNLAPAQVILAFLTTSSNPDDEKKAAAIPEITDYLQKPLNSEKLKTLLKKHFKSW